MLANPDHKEIRELAAAMLHRLDSTPDGLQRLDAAMLPIAEFTNGIRRPNSTPPTTVFVTLDGQRWRKCKGGKWSKA